MVLYNDRKCIDGEQQVELLKRQYLQLVDPDQLSLPSFPALRLPDVQAQIYKSMFVNSTHTYTPPERYQYRVLKRLINQLEQAIQDPDEDEISNDLTDSFAKLLNQEGMPKVESVQEKSYVTYTMPSELQNSSPPSVTLLETRRVLASSGNTGLRTWEAALRLGTYLCSEEGRELVRGKTVLELGAGAGFLSILCAEYLEARYVLATDGSEMMVDVLQSNISLNGWRDYPNVRGIMLEWGDTLSDAILSGSEEDQQYDLVLGADIIYDPAAIPLLVATLRELLARYPNAKVLLSTTLRNKATIDSFLNTCDLKGLYIAYLDLKLVQDAEQTGFFHSIAMPMLGLSVTKKPVNPVTDGSFPVQQGMAPIEDVYHEL